MLGPFRKPLGEKEQKMDASNHKLTLGCGEYDQPKSQRSTKAKKKARAIFHKKEPFNRGERRNAQLLQVTSTKSQKDERTNAVMQKEDN